MYIVFLEQDVNCPEDMRSVRVMRMTLRNEEVRRGRVAVATQHMRQV